LGTCARNQGRIVLGRGGSHPDPVSGAAQMTLLFIWRVHIRLPNRRVNPTVGAALVEKKGGADPI